MKKMMCLDLFSGIGGFSLGFEAAGMRTAAFCESDPFCARLLARMACKNKDYAGADKARQRQFGRSVSGGRKEWPREPGIHRVDDGLPDWVDRLRALGNTVVPAIPEMIGRAIIAAEAR